MTKSAKIRKLLAKNLDAAEVAKRLKIPVNYVYTVKWLDKKKKKPSKIVKAAKQMERELAKVRKQDAKLMKFKKDPKAEAWLKENPWFGVSKPRTAYALGLHEELVRSGVDAKSDEYWKRVDEGMSIFPGKEKKKYRMQAAFDKPVVLESIAETREKIRDQTERELIDRVNKPTKLIVQPQYKDVAIKLLADNDLVNHPPHYKSGGIETIDFIEAKDLNYRLGNVVKYVSRAGRKATDPIEDLKKAAWYLQREISARENA